DSMGEDRVMSFDVVPVFTIGDPDKDGHYELPDEKTSKGWTETDPRVHYDKAVSAQRAFSNEWKGMVRMAKAWNRQAAKLVKPSFLLEVMAFDLLRPPFGGDFPREFMAFFHSAADRIHETWPDPAGLGPAVSDAMDNTARDTARKALIDASYTVREGIQLS